MKGTALRQNCSLISSRAKHTLLRPFGTPVSGSWVTSENILFTCTGQAVLESKTGLFG